MNWLENKDKLLNPEWLDRKIAEQEAEKAKAACGWEDVAIIESANLNDTPFIMYESGAYSIADIQTHPRFAGIVNSAGVLFQTWHHYAIHNNSACHKDGDLYGYRIPKPAFVRMWKKEVQS
jgi:hypothetical protein